MRIAVDARLNAYRVGGIPQYTYQLLTALVPLMQNDDELIILQHYKQLQPLLRNVRTSTLFTPPHHRLEQWTMPVEMVRLLPNVLHCPDFIAPRFRPCRAVVTIHDLAFVHYPEILDKHARRYYGQVRDSIQHADAVIAVSKATKHDICEWFDVPPKRVDVVYEAAASVFTPIQLKHGEERVFTQPLFGSKPISLQVGTFALFVSTIEPRKNLPTLLHAMHVCCKRRPATPYQLVMAGHRGWNDEAIFQEIRHLELSDVVKWIGSVSQEELLWLYNACLCYVNPSLYEGFGLPVLEALACGAPSLISTAGSLPEIAGDAALLLPPLDVAAWADAIEQIWHNEQKRVELAHRGPQQANQFSWKRAARETLAIYRRIC